MVLSQLLFTPDLLKWLNLTILFKGLSLVALYCIILMTVMQTFSWFHLWLSLDLWREGNPGIDALLELCNLLFCHLKGKELVVLRSCWVMHWANECGKLSLPVNLQIKLSRQYEYEDGSVNLLHQIQVLAPLSYSRQSTQTKTEFSIYPRTGGKMLTCTLERKYVCKLVIIVRWKDMKIIEKCILIILLFSTDVSHHPSPFCWWI